MKFSIIIPVYNAENKIIRCVESIENQAYSDYEVLLINDGSKDGSFEACRMLSSRYSNISVFDKANGGASSARNVGLYNAKGEYILFVDSDDYVAENYFEMMDRQCLKNGLVVYTNSWLRADGFSKREINGNLNETSLFEKTEYLLSSRTINGPYPKIFSRSIIENNKLRFDERMPVAEDFNFCLAYLMQCADILIYNEAVYVNDQTNDDSLSRGRKNGLIDIYPIVFDTAYETINSSRFGEEEKQKLFKIWDKLHTESFGTCVMEALKDKRSFAETRREIRAMCIKFQKSYPKTYGYCGLIHLTMRLMIKYKLAGMLLFLGKIYVRMRDKNA